MQDKNKSIGYELLRFVITGAVCAVLDYLVCQIFLEICSSLSKEWSQVISTAMGFIFGVVLNFILSTFWVYKNVSDETNKKSKTPLFITIFVTLSFVALLLSIGTMSLCTYLCDVWWGIDISESSLKEIFTFNFWGDVVFWAYFISFCLRTLIGLIWNYFTRKFILYKAPKQDTDTKENI